MPIMIYITCASKEEARGIARNLVEQKLIACANIFAMESIYWWKENIEESAEYVLIAKGREEDFKILEFQVKALHSYEVPCIIAVPIIDGHVNYLSWIQGSTQR